MLGLQAGQWALSSIPRNTGGQVLALGGLAQTWHTCALPGEENTACEDVQGEEDFF